jgi:hypothetical protein
MKTLATLHDARVEMIDIALNTDKQQSHNNLINLSNHRCHLGKLGMYGSTSTNNASLGLCKCVVASGTSGLGQP